MTDKTVIHIGDGQGEGFWDVSFTDEQLTFAEVDREDMRGICISIDDETGEVSLNDGYMPGSPPFVAENSLFDDFEPAIIEALLNDHRIKRFHPKFIVRAADDYDRRRERIVDLARRMDEREADDDEFADHADAVAH